MPGFTNSQNGCISNPGGLVSAISKADFGRKSFSRNPLIFGLFTRMDMVEKIGSSIGRMNKLMSEPALPKQEYRTEGMFTVIFKRPIKLIPDMSVEMSGQVSVEMSVEIYSDA